MEQKQFLLHNPSHTRAGEGDSVYSVQRCSDNFGPNSSGQLWACAYLWQLSTSLISEPHYSSNLQPTILLPKLQGKLIWACERHAMQATHTNPWVLKWINPPLHFKPSWPLQHVTACTELTTAVLPFKKQVPANKFVGVLASIWGLPTQWMLTWNCTQHKHNMNTCK